MLYPHLNIPEPEWGYYVERADLIRKIYSNPSWDAINIGPYDLALGVEGLFRDNIAKLPFVSTNLVFENTKKHIFEPYLIKEIDGFRVGIIGLVSKNSLLQDSEKEGISVADPLFMGREAVAELKEKDCQIIILLSQLSSSENYIIASEITDIHFIIGGISKTSVYHPLRIKDTVLLMGDKNGRSLGKVGLMIGDNALQPISFSSANDKTLSATARYHFQSVLMDKELPKDKDVLEDLALIKEKYQHLLNQKKAHKNEGSNIDK